LELDDFDFTPDQRQELEQYPKELIAAWIKASTHPSVKSPSGFVLSGIRSGAMPFGLSSDDERRSLKVRQAERWITNAGIFCPTAQEVLDELFYGPSSLLRYYRADDALRGRMVTLWKLERPYGEQTEQEFLERAARNRR
jgi:hypothetical protein